MNEFWFSLSVFAFVPMYVLSHTSIFSHPLHKLHLGPDTTMWQNSIWNRFWIFIGILCWARLDWKKTPVFSERSSHHKHESPKVPFHGIISPYSYFEVIWIFAPIEFRTKQNLIKKNISGTEIKSLLKKPINVLSFYTSSQNSNLLYSEVDFLKRS